MTHNPEETLHAVPLETLLEQGNILKIKPQGYSMYPLFIPGRDEALIEQVPTTQLKRGDVVLYRRRHGILVLHRICRITPAGYHGYRSAGTTAGSNTAGSDTGGRHHRS